GTMHNYMRMYWGKKMIEWSASFEEAFDSMEHLNNLYAYDGRDPNSYTGILWCFGLFDRPWFPERNVLGNFRYMSGPSMRKKFKMDAYLAYTDNLDRNNGGLFG
ncbi:MAG TPA: deoxyribodipyrimidine photolyase, partial [Leptospiraceae bacterium]|nr:deoxyribodipyrimidine photolyase [Leptospiraceae bacterium]